jgi:hypothetical protein
LNPLLPTSSQKRVLRFFTYIVKRILTLGIASASQSRKHMFLGVGALPDGHLNFSGSQGPCTERLVAVLTRLKLVLFLG